MLKNDLWINQKASEGMINPFQPSLVRHLNPAQEKQAVLSYGCSSYGYDLRLSKILIKHTENKKFNPKTETVKDEDGSFILPKHGRSCLKISSENITVICRQGIHTIIVNTTCGGDSRICNSSCRL